MIGTFRRIKATGQLGRVIRTLDCHEGSSRAERLLILELGQRLQHGAMEHDTLPAVVQRGLRLVVDNERRV